MVKPKAQAIRDDWFMRGQGLALSLMADAGAPPETCAARCTGVRG